MKKNWRDKRLSEINWKPLGIAVAIYAGIAVSAAACGGGNIKADQTALEGRPKAQIEVITAPTHQRALYASFYTIRVDGRLCTVMEAGEGAGLDCSDDAQ